MPTMAERVVAEALEWRGTKYAHQRSLKGVGTDCLGLVMGVYRAVIGPHEKPPPYSPDWAESSMEEHMLEAGRRYLVERNWNRGDAFVPGDVLVFRYRPTSAAKHASIVVSPTEMIHAYNNLNTQVVTISEHWQRLIAGVFYFPEE